MSMAVLVSNKTTDFQYHVQCMQTFLMECGRVQAVLNSTIIQSDQEEHLIALPRARAAKMGGNMRKHYSSTSTYVHITSTRQLRTLPQNTDGTNQNTEVTTTKQL